MDGGSGEQFREELSRLDKRIDLLAEQAKQTNEPWYRNTSTLISVAALLFSLGSTVVAGWHTKEQDTHNLRTELRGLLQQLAALPKENIEVFQKYSSDPATASALSGLINNQNVILAKQADELLRRLPKEEVSATDYIAVSNALVSSRMFDAAIADLNRALVAGSILDDEVGALRNLGNLEMNLGKTGDARAHFQQAADIFGKDQYRGYDQFTKLFTNVTTELGWAYSEGAVGNGDAFQQHVGKAEQLVNSMPQGSQADFLTAEIAQLKAGKSLSFGLPITAAAPASATPGGSPLGGR